MTKKQKEKIISVIEKDATLIGEYVGSTPEKACVIGGLALAAGVDPKVFYEDNTGLISKDYYEPVRRKIRGKFGLLKTQLGHLQMINDNADSVGIRRRKLIAYIKSL